MEMEHRAMTYLRPVMLLGVCYQSRTVLGIEVMLLYNVVAMYQSPTILLFIFPLWLSVMAVLAGQRPSAMVICHLAVREKGTRTPEHRSIALSTLKPASSCRRPSLLSSLPPTRHH